MQNTTLFKMETQDLTCVMESPNKITLGQIIVLDIVKLKERTLCRLKLNFRVWRISFTLSSSSFRLLVGRKRIGNVLRFT